VDYNSVVMKKDINQSRCLRKVTEGIKPALRVCAIILCDNLRYQKVSMGAAQFSSGF
jgi:hypothetical protein